MGNGMDDATGGASENFNLQPTEGRVESGNGYSQSESHAEYREPAAPAFIAPPPPPPEARPSVVWSSSAATPDTAAPPRSEREE